MQSRKGPYADLARKAASMKMRQAPPMEATYNQSASGLSPMAQGNRPPYPQSREPYAGGTDTFNGRDYSPVSPGPRTSPPAPRAEPFSAFQSVMTNMQPQPMQGISPPPMQRQPQMPLSQVASDNGFTPGAGFRESMPQPTPSTGSMAPPARPFAPQSPRTSGAPAPPFFAQSAPEPTTSPSPMAAAPASVQARSATPSAPSPASGQAQPMRYLAVTSAEEAYKANGLNGLIAFAQAKAAQEQAAKQAYATGGLDALIRLAQQQERGLTIPVPVASGQTGYV